MFRFILNTCCDDVALEFHLLFRLGIGYLRIYAASRMLERCAPIGNFSFGTGCHLLQYLGLVMHSG